jgi:integrase
VWPWAPAIRAPQARYLGPDGIDRRAPDTFATKTDAEVWLTMKEAEIRRGNWLNPDAGTILIADYGAAWIEERPGLRPKTVMLYRYLLRAHIVPYFQTVTVAAITPRYRALVLLATFASLRWAELAALRVRDIDTDARIVRVTRQISYPRGGGHLFGSPKSKAGRRVVAFPDLIVADLRKHLEALNADDLVFTSPEGSPLRHSNFYRRAWTPALTATGLAGVHFHDLRHAGNQLSAEAGANLRELMARMDHDSTRAASIYLHSSAERQRTIAHQVGENAKTALGKRSGTQRARRRGKPS